MCAGGADLAGRGQGWRELAGGEGVKGAEALGKFGGGQAAHAVEAAEIIRSRNPGFAHVAVEAAGDQIAIAARPVADLGHDVVQAELRPGDVPKAVKASPALAAMNRVAQVLLGGEIQRLQIDFGAGAVETAGRANFMGQKEFHDVAAVRPGSNTQGAFSSQAAESAARRGGIETERPGEPGNREAIPTAPLQAGVATQQGVRGALDHGEAQAGHEKVFEVFPGLFGVGFFVFHGASPEGQRERSSRRTGIWDDYGKTEVPERKPVRRSSDPGASARKEKRRTV